MAWLDVKGKSNLTDAVGREEAEGRERKVPGCPGVARTGLIGIRIPFVGGKENGCGERRGSHRKEGRKEEKRREEKRREEKRREEKRREEKKLFGTMGNRINVAKTSGYSMADKVRLRAFGDNYRRVYSILTITLRMQVKSYRSKFLFRA